MILRFCTACQELMSVVGVDREHIVWECPNSHREEVS